MSKRTRHYEEEGYWEKDVWGQYHWFPTSTQMQHPVSQQSSYPSANQQSGSNQQSDSQGNRQNLPLSNQSQQHQMAPQSSDTVQENDGQPTEDTWDDDELWEAFINDPAWQDIDQCLLESAEGVPGLQQDIQPHQAVQPASIPVQSASIPVQLASIPAPRASDQAKNQPKPKLFGLNMPLRDWIAIQQEALDMDQKQMTVAMRCRIYRVNKEKATQKASGTFKPAEWPDEDFGNSSAVAADLVAKWFPDVIKERPEPPEEEIPSKIYRSVRSKGEESRSWDDHDPNQ